MNEGQSLFGGLEKAISGAPSYQPSDKTYSDKVLGKEEISKIELLVQKPVLTAGDWRTVQYLLGASESKLVNLSDETRYYLGKYITWINDSFTIALSMLQYKEKVDRDPTNTQVSRDALWQAYELMDKCLKEMVFAYLYWLRSSLSLSAMAFDSLTKNKIEQQYFAHGLPGAPEQQKQGITNLIFRGKQ